MIDPKQLLLEIEGLNKLFILSEQGNYIAIRWRLVNQAGAVIDYVLNNKKGLYELLEHIRKYRWRGIIQYTTTLPAYMTFDQDEIENLTNLCRLYRDCSVGIKWGGKSYYELSGYDRYTLEEDPKYFEDEDSIRHTGYILLLESDLFPNSEYFYLNDDKTGAY